MKIMQIIYINGPSSSGKTTLSKALQHALEYPFLHVSLDRVIGMMPERINNWEGGEAPLGFSWKQSVDAMGHPIHEIQTGPFARKMAHTFIEIVLTLAKMGHYIIIDDVSLGKEQVDLWKEALINYEVLWIGINAPLNILENREKERNNRILGSARGQYFQVHQNVVYDLEFDTSKEPIDTIVDVISKRIATNFRHSLDEQSMGMNK